MIGSLPFVNRLRYFIADAWDEWRHSLGVNLLALGTLTAALRAGDGYVVQGLDRDVADVAAARAHIFVRHDGRIGLACQTPDYVGSTARFRQNR